jgi:hypothetical protein
MVHSFETKVVIPSVVAPGIVYTIRRLSKKRRAERDLALAVHNIRLSELNELARDERAPYADRLAKEVDPVNWPDYIPVDVRTKLTDYGEESSNITEIYIKPATIRAGLISIEGLEYDGQKATADLLIENGPDEVAQELYAFILIHQGLSVKEQGNSSSSSDSVGPVDGKVPTTTVADASAPEITGSASAVSSQN